MEPRSAAMTVAGLDEPAVPGQLPRAIELAEDPDPLFDDLIAAVRRCIEARGIDPDGGPNAPLLAIGRPGRHPALSVAAAGRARVVWTGEPLPQPRAGSAHTAADGRRPRRRTIPPPIARPIGRVVRALPLPAPLDARRIALTSRRLVAANLAEVRSAHAAGTAIVVTSRDRGARLAMDGIPAAVVPFGYHERHAGPLTAPSLPRRHAMVMLGSPAPHTRRARAVEEMARRAGADLLVATSAWGDDRARLLAQTKVVVDVQRIPGNFTGIRLLLALAAGAAVVTEPMTDPWPFEPGVHFLEASLPDLLETGRALAADEPRRRAIVDAGQELLRTRLTMAASVDSVLTVVSRAAADAAGAGA